MTSGTSVLYRYGRARPLEAVERVGMTGALREARRRAIDHLRGVYGGSVLDLACGSGPLLGDLSRVVGPEGLVVGVDASAPLVREAERRTASLGNVRLRNASWPAPLEEAPFDGAVCCLGMSVIPEWEAGLEAVTAAVRPGGPIAIVDWLVDDGDGVPLRAYVRVGSWLAGADPGRPIAERACELLRDARVERLPVGLWLVTGRAG